jgi:hypothetical protein
MLVLQVHEQELFGSDSASAWVNGDIEKIIETHQRPQPAESEASSTALLEPELQRQKVLVPEKPKMKPEEEQKRQPAKLEISQQIMNNDVKDIPQPSPTAQKSENEVPQYFTIDNTKLRIKYHNGKYPVVDYYVWEKLGRPRLLPTMITEITVGPPGSFYQIKGTFEMRIEGMTGLIPVLVVDKPHLETEELDIYFGTNGKLPSEKFEQESLYSLARKEPIDGSAKLLEEKVHPDKPKMIPEQQKRQPAKIENSQQMNVNVPQQPKTVPQQPIKTVPQQPKTAVPQQPKQVLTENPPPKFLDIYNTKLRIKYHDGKYPVINYNVWNKLGKPQLSYAWKNEKIDSPGRYYNKMGQIYVEFTFKDQGSKDMTNWVPILVVDKPYVETEELEIHLGTNGGQTFDEWDSLYQKAWKMPMDRIRYYIKTKMTNRDEEVKKRKDSKK